MRTKVFYCWECRKDRVHRLVERSTVGSDSGIFRPILAVMSLGVSEMCADEKWQCEKCGEIIRK